MEFELNFAFEASWPDGGVLGVLDAGMGQACVPGGRARIKTALAM